MSRELKCPKCEAVIEETARVFRCSSRRETEAGAAEAQCNFVLFKDCLSKLGKKEITATELSKLVAGKTIPLKLVSQKTGKQFECKGELEVRSNGYYSVRLIFEDKQPKPVTVPDETVTDDDSPAEEY